jgi:hypothetical protein
VEEIPPEGARRAGRPMSREQVVFFGAGASHGRPTLPLDGVDPTRRSPVVAELFDEGYSCARDGYPLVREVAAMSQPIIARGAVAFEGFLRESYRDSPPEHEHGRERYWSVPLYLQELMVRCSANYTRDQDALLRLVSTARRNQHVNFVTLNYDTILDEILESAGVSLSGLRRSGRLGIERSGSGTGRRRVGTRPRRVALHTSLGRCQRGARR